MQRPWKGPLCTSLAATKFVYALRALPESQVTPLTVANVQMVLFTPRGVPLAQVQASDLARRQHVGAGIRIMICCADMHSQTRLIYASATEGCSILGTKVSLATTAYGPAGAIDPFGPATQKRRGNNAEGLRAIVAIATGCKISKIPTDLSTFPKGPGMRCMAIFDPSAPPTAALPAPHDSPSQIAEIAAEHKQEQEDRKAMKASMAALRKEMAKSGSRALLSDLDAAANSPQAARPPVSAAQQPPVPAEASASEPMEITSASPPASNAPQSNTAMLTDAEDQTGSLEEQGRRKVAKVTQVPKASSQLCAENDRFHQLNCTSSSTHTLLETITSRRLSQAYFSAASMHSACMPANTSDAHHTQLSCCLSESSLDSSAGPFTAQAKSKNYQLKTQTMQSMYVTIAKVHAGIEALPCLICLSRQHANEPSLALSCRSPSHVHHNPLADL